MRALVKKCQSVGGDGCVDDGKNVRVLAVTDAEERRQGRGRERHRVPAATRAPGDQGLDWQWWSSSSSSETRTAHRLALADRLELT